MELRQLRYFESVARLGHVTHAAEELHVAQPAVSQQIQALERELHVALFDRIGRRVELTEAGGALLVYIRDVLRLVEEIRREAGERAGGVSGRVRIGAPPTVSTHVLPGILADFRKQYPAIELQLREDGNQRLLALLCDGSLDLTVAALPVVDPSLESNPLWTEELVLAVSISHRLAELGSVAWSELVDEPLVLFAPGYELRDVTLEACRLAGFSPQVVVDGAATDTALRFAAAGLGLALLPRLALEGVPDVRPVTITDQRLARTLGLVWRRGSRVLPAVHTLRREILRRSTDGRRLV